MEPFLHNHPFSRLLQTMRKVAGTITARLQEFIEELSQKNSSVSASILQGATSAAIGDCIIFLDVAKTFGLTRWTCNQNKTAEYISNGG